MAYAEVALVLASELRHANSCLQIVPSSRMDRMADGEPLSSLLWLGCQVVQGLGNPGVQKASGWL